MITRSGIIASSKNENGQCSVTANPTSISFSSCPAGEPSSIESFIFNGSNLGAAVGIYSIDENTQNITIKLSLSPLGPFTDTLTISGSTIPPTTIYVQYTPEFVGANTGTISASTLTGICDFDDIVLVDITATPVPPLPPLPLVFTNVTISNVDLIGVTPGDGNPPSVEYAIQDAISGLYLDGSGYLQTNPQFAGLNDWDFYSIYGLLPETTYDFRAVAKSNITGLTTNGAITSITTPAPTVPYIGIIPSGPAEYNFGSSPIGVPVVKSAQLRGWNLDGTDVNILAFPFNSTNDIIKLSFNPTGPFISGSTGLFITGYGTSFPWTTVYIEFTPEIIGYDVGDFGAVGGGAGSSVLVSINGT